MATIVGNCLPVLDVLWGAIREEAMNSIQITVDLSIFWVNEILNKSMDLLESHGLIAWPVGGTVRSRSPARRTVDTSGGSLSTNLLHSCGNGSQDGTGTCSLTASGTRAFNLIMFTTETFKSVTQSAGLDKSWAVGLLAELAFGLERIPCIPMDTCKSLPLTRCGM